MVHTALTSATIGMMIFFSGVITPIAFKNLDENTLKIFLRAVFPKLFLIGAFTSGISSIILATSNQRAAFICVAITFTGFLINLYWLTKQINNARDQMEKGDSNAKKTFQNLHRVSVAIYLTQIVLLITSLAIGR